jgi:hypothetical protein
MKFVERLVDCKYIKPYTVNHTVRENISFKQHYFKDIYTIRLHVLIVILQNNIRSCRLTS